jgi:Fe2+-dicitrate sensor, membrane component
MTTSTLRSSSFRPAIRLLPLLVSVFLFSVTALAQSHARIVRLSYVDGNVEMDKGDGRGFSPAYLNMPVTSQSKLWARDGQAEVEFEDGSTVRLTPDTILNFQQLDSDNNGDRLSTLVLQDGTAYFDLNHRDGDQFDVQFAAETLRLTHSAHFRIDAEKGETELAVFSGEVQVAARGGVRSRGEKRRNHSRGCRRS